MSPQDARTQARATPANEKAQVEPRRTERVPENDNAPLVGFSQIAALAAAGDSTRPEAIRPDTLLNLQKRAGNAAVVSLMRPMAARRASLLVQRRAKPVKKSAGGGHRPSTVAQRAPAAGATATAPTTEAPSEKEDVDTSEFTDDPKGAAAKLASMPAPARPVPPPPVLPAPAPKPPVVKKAPVKKVAGPVKKGRPPAKKKAGGKPQKAPAVGEIVKKPAPPLPPRYVPGSKLPPPPVPPKVIPPTQDPAFKKVAMAAKQTVKAAKKHPKGKQESGAALAAAKSPANEQLALAQVVRTGHMEQKAKPKPFNEAAFVEAVMAEIEKTKPKNFDESGKVDQKAESAKGAIAQQVGANKQAAAGDVEKESKEEPKLSEGEDRKEQPLPPLEIAKPGGLAASAAMPAPVPNEQIDFRHGPASVDREMADAGITEQQLAESNEPEFIGALEAKKEGEEHTQKAPAEIRKAEGDILKKASAQVAGAEKNAVIGANSAIGGSTKAIGAAKKSTIDKDEAERKKVSDGINDIFKATQKDVGDILKNLDTTVDDLFTKSEKSIREAFTYDWKVRLQNYKDERYSGFWGPGRWVRDKFKGLPKKAKELFAKSQAMYESMMRKLVKRIAGIVSAELTKATNRIKDGRQQVITYVQGLKGEQAKFGAEAAKEMDDRFDQLDADVKDKFDEMASTVAKKYSESRTAVAEEVKEAWDAEKGLIDKAIDKIKGVYKAISDLKDLFFRVLAKIADVITTILANPVRFIRNFFNAVKAGVERFRDNIETHLKSGLMGWLTGNLGGKGIEIPDSFDLPSMGKLVLSVFGLGWTFIKERLAKKIGPAGMAALDSGASLVEKLKGGPAALWEMVSEKFTDFGSMVMDKIQDFIQNKIVMAGITFLISMLNPASAFIKACKMIYDVIVFIIDRGKEIGEFVESIIDAAGDIARGGGGGVPEKIEGVLAKALPLAIGFCASLLSLGGIGDKVRDIIDGVRKPIFKAMDKVIDFVVNTTRPIWEPAKRLFERGAKKGRELYASGKAKLDEGVESVKAGARRAKGYVTEKASAVKAKIFPPKRFAMKGAQHTLSLDPSAAGEVIMASRPERLSAKIGRAIGALKRQLQAGPSPELQKRHDSLVAIGGMLGQLRRAKDHEAQQKGLSRVADALALHGMEFDVKDLDIDPMTASKKLDFLDRDDGLPASVKAEFVKRVSAMAVRDNSEEGLWKTMRAVVKAQPSAFLLKGPKLTEADVAARMGASRAIGLGDVWRLMLNNGYRRRWGAAGDSAAYQKWVADIHAPGGETFDPDVDIDPKASLSKPGSTGWWIPKDRSGAAVVGQLIKDLALQGARYAEGAVEFTMDAAKAAGLLHRPTVLDGIEFEEHLIPRAGGYKDPKWGITAGGIEEAVAKFLTAENAPKRRFIPATEIPAMYGAAKPGVIYLRRDRSEKMPNYVGQAESEARFRQRQREHQKDHPTADFEFTIIARGMPRPELDRLEEEFMIRGGGPKTKREPEGRLANKRHEMSSKRLVAAGGRWNR